MDPGQLVSNIRGRTISAVLIEPSNIRGRKVSAVFIAYEA